MSDGNGNTLIPHNNSIIIQIVVVKKFACEKIVLISVVVVVVLAPSLPVRILGECLAIHSLPELFFFFLLGRGY